MRIEKGIIKVSHNGEEKETLIIKYELSNVIAKKILQLIKSCNK